jgi:hypothetical protein
MSEIIDVKLSGVRWLTAVRFPKVVLSGFVCLLTLALWQTPDQPVSHAVDIPIPTQADWTDYGTIFEAGAVGEWDYQLWGGFAGSAVKHDGTGTGAD